MSLLFLNLSILFFFSKTPFPTSLPLPTFTPFSYPPLTPTHPTYNSLYKSCHLGLDASAGVVDVIAAETAKCPAGRGMEEEGRRTTTRRRRRGRYVVAPTDVFVVIIGIILVIIDVVNANVNVNANANKLSLSLSLSLENFGPSKFTSLFKCTTVPN